MDCPFCGKEARRGQTHFSFSANGYKCWVCGAKGGLKALADHLRLDAPLISRQPPEQKPPPPVARWRENPERLLDGYWSHPQKYRAWADYKPISRSTIDRYRFGYGRLPFQDADGHWYMSRQEWLIVPLFERGQLVGLRGRNLTNRGPKWISATGSAYTLWGVEDIKANDTVWLCENYVDAAWLMESHCDWKAVALGGATTWKPIWTEYLRSRSPECVIVALDNDLAGQATGARLEQLRQQWASAHPGLSIPIPNGPKIANQLLACGIKAMLFEWPSCAPIKAGLDWGIEHGHFVA